MNLKEAYTEVADRSIKSAEATMSANLQESVAFHSYHAFESLGGALCASVGDEYPRGHSKKINQFVSAANKGGLKAKIGYDVAYIAALISSIRNKCLYPEELPDGSIELPSDFISTTDAKDILKRTQGVLKKVKSHL